MNAHRLVALCAALATMIFVAPAARAQTVSVRNTRVASSIGTYSPSVRVATPTFRTAVYRTGPTSTYRPPAPPPAPEPARAGSVECGIRDNGAYAPGTIEVRDQGRVIASGDCSSALDVPAGTYYATLTLTSAVDRPQQTVMVRVPEGGRAIAAASFATSILEVRFTKDRQAVYGLGILRRAGAQIATLGSGVAIRVSSGNYELVQRYRTEERVVSVSLTPGQRLAVRADF